MNKCPSCNFRRELKVWIILLAIMLAIPISIVIVMALLTGMPILIAGSILAIILLTILVITLLLAPRTCTINDGKLILRTFLRTKIYKVLSVDDLGCSDDLHEWRNEHLGGAAVGFRMWPWVNAYVPVRDEYVGEYGEDVLIFSGLNCNCRWRLVNYLDEDGSTKYAVVCCGD